MINFYYMYILLFDFQKLLKGGKAMCEKKVASWRELAEKLYNEGTDLNEICEQVYNEFKTSFKAKDSSARTIKRYINHKFPVAKSAQTPKTFEEQISEQCEKILNSEEARKDKKLLTKLAITDMIIDSIKDVIRERPYRDIKPFEVKVERNYSEETLVLMISDIQAGTYISKESSGGLNEYNWHILEKQLYNFIKVWKKSLLAINKLLPFILCMFILSATL